MNEKSKKICVSGMVLGIVGIVFSFIFPAVSYSCSVTGLVMGLKKRKTHNSTAAIALNIVALSVAAINSLCGVLVTLKMFRSGKPEKTSGTKLSAELD